jgi:hypothetical protein
MEFQHPASPAVQLLRLHAGLPITVAAAPLNGDSNWLNNVVTVQLLGRGQ